VHGRFITENSIEEKVLERAWKKLFLDAMVVQQGRLTDKHKSANKDELLEMIRCAVICADAPARANHHVLTSTCIE